MPADLTPAPLKPSFSRTKSAPSSPTTVTSATASKPRKVKGGLLLDTREGLLKGGETGPAIVPGDPEKSLLIKAIRYTDPDLQMPPKGKKLTDDQIAEWSPGSKWARRTRASPRSPKRPGRIPAQDALGLAAARPNRQFPKSKDASWAKTPVDNFILAKLEEKDLKPNPPADKRTLIRRATFDLIGLPPTPEEVEDFVKDESPDAFAKVVDRLLASPHYGERWGRHWLDVARYSDTKGQMRRQP